MVGAGGTPARHAEKCWVGKPWREARSLVRGWSGAGHMAELPVVDNAERERVRSGLKRYKELHGGIGDPELQQRIMFALNCGESSVPLSTLQRFIRGTHRTDDVMVRRYRKFLSKVAPPLASDELGAALAKFLMPVLEEAGWQGKFAGEYRTYVEAAKTKPGAKAKFSAGCSVVRLKAAENTAYLHATEFIIDPEQQDGKEAQASWLGNTGVFTPVGSDQYLMIVRSILEVRVYMLRKVLNEPLTLHGHAWQPGSMFPLAIGLPGSERKPVTEFVMSAVANDKAANN
jgi:hypothetical protein